MNKVIIEPSDTYHAEKAHVTSTALRKMLLSPAHFNAYMKATKKKSTQSQERGTFFHDILLEQNPKKYAPWPLKSDGSKLPINTPEYKDWFAKLPKGTVPAKPDDYAEMMTILTAFADNKEIMKLYNGAKVENSIYAIDHETGVKIKARPDIWGSGYLVDLKSCGNIDSYFEKSIFQQAYDVQLAHYAETIFNATGEMINDFYIIAFESDAPYASKIFQIDKPSIKIARQEVRRLLNQVKVCTEDQKWPAYSSEIIQVARPAYLEARSEVSFEDVV